MLLKRGEDREFWRLSSLLRRKADQGVQQLAIPDTADTEVSLRQVKVSILLYKEVAAVLGINSFHSKRELLQHDGIRVIRHPDHAPIPSIWAHHEVRPSGVFPVQFIDFQS